jgi:hypothetical protein
MAFLTFLVDLFSVLSFFACIWAIRDYQKHGGLSYPPGPRPLPIIGNLLDIPKDSSWLAYTQFSKKYGNSRSFPIGSLSDSNNRGYHVLPRLWAGCRRVELGQSGQGLARKEWRHLLRSSYHPILRHVSGSTIESDLG